MWGGCSALKMGIYVFIPKVFGFVAQPAMGHFPDWFTIELWATRGWTKINATAACYVGVSIFSF